MPVTITDKLPLVLGNEERLITVRLAKKAQDIKKLSQLFSPLLTGDLIASHKVDKGTRGQFKISANTPYATRRHFENNKNPSTRNYLAKAGVQIGSLPL
jgi:hypothetical protein